jgi:hypothetical protein
VHPTVENMNFIARLIGRCDRKLGPKVGDKQFRGLNPETGGLLGDLAPDFPTCQMELVGVVQG